MKVFFDTVGCRLNQAEIEHLAGEFRASGHTIIDSARGADLVVINTCAVTAAAASDSRQKARQAYHAGAKQIVLTGCLATLQPELGEELPGVTQLVANQEKSHLLSLILNKDEDFDHEPLVREPLPGVRKRTRAFIKAQDGCNNSCTFCVTRLARGRAMSVPKEQVLRDMIAAENGGAREVVLSGVHLGSWGIETGSKENLTDLIAYLLKNSTIPRLRLSSTEPWDLDIRFFDLWQDPRLCQHFHLPLQSGSAGVLKRMARHTTPEKYRELIQTAREMIPGVAITTDIIVGFPGETEQEFADSVAFVKEMEFAGGHVFKYSARQGTAAARMPGQVHGTIAHERSQLMRDVLEESTLRYAASQVGTELDVLWERAVQVEANIWQLHGLTGNYLQVLALANSDQCNKIDRVKIQTLNGNELLSEIIIDKSEHK